MVEIDEWYAFGERNPPKPKRERRGHLLHKRRMAGHHTYYHTPGEKGKGWHGERQRHKEVAERAQAKHAQNKPMKKKEKYGSSFMEHENGVKSGWELGTKVKLRADVLQRHFQSIIPSPVFGYTREQFEWRETLASLKGKTGVVTQFFPNSKVDVNFNGHLIRINSSELVVVPKNLKNHEGKKETTKQAHFSPPYRVDLWEERDRLIITVYDKNDKEVASWVDDDARQMFEDGFFDSRDLKQSVLEYLKDVKIIKGG